MNPSASPTLADVIAQGVHWVLDGVHTSLPGRVVSVKGNGLVNVEPTLKRAMVDGSSKAFPVVNNVPLMWPTTQDGGLRLPVKAGDPVLLVVSERSLERWKESGALSVADDGAHFQLKDAVAIPGLWAKGNAYTPKGDATSAELGFKNARVEIKADGGIEVINQNGSISMSADGKMAIKKNSVTYLDPTGLPVIGPVELLEVVKDFLTAYQNLKTSNAVPGSPCTLFPADAPKVASLVSRISGMMQ